MNTVSSKPLAQQGQDMADKAEKDASRSSNQARSAPTPR